MSTSEKKDEDIVIKIGMLGDVSVGKTSLMVRYVEDTFDDDYIYTLGVSFKEKKIKIKNNTVKLMIWDMGGQKQFMSMLDVVCNEAVALLYCFDLARPSTLTHIKQWYVKSRKQNKKALAFLIGMKYDKFIELSYDQQEDITQTARKYASKMKCPLVFCSSAASINVKKLFKLVLSKVFDINPNIKKLTKIGEPVLEYEDFAKIEKNA